MPLDFHIHESDPKIERRNRYRRGVVHLPHGKMNTPVFMPVGTYGTLKGINSAEITNTLGFEMILANSYHIGNRPGCDLLQLYKSEKPPSLCSKSKNGGTSLNENENGFQIQIQKESCITKMKKNVVTNESSQISYGFGGLHNLMKYTGNLLTDSGGFQIVSLDSLSTVTEEGVLFTDPHKITSSRELTTDEEITPKKLFTPEESMRTQCIIGADIVMALDDVVASTCPDKKRVDEGVDRSIRWLKRCRDEFYNIDGHLTQNLFGIVQGGIYPDLRERSLKETIDIDLPGYAIGGLSGGESKDDFWAIVSLCTQRLPWEKPRYVMGVGYPLDIICCISMGVDMFDCVYPTRTARFGTALTSYGQLRLSRSEFANDIRPIEIECPCEACHGHSSHGRYYPRSILHRICGKTASAARIITIHNLTYMKRLLDSCRDAIHKGTFEEFTILFLSNLYGDNHRPPDWVFECLENHIDRNIRNKFDLSLPSGGDMPLYYEN